VPPWLLRSTYNGWIERKMGYTTQETSDAVVLTPGRQPTASVIWLHGLGADGYDFVPIVDELRLPAELAIRFVFPHAAMRPVTINNGFVMRAWYDIRGFGPGVGEDDEGIVGSQRIVTQFIERELASGLSSERLVLAGFSQGGAMALHTAVRYERKLAGVLALSTYLPLRTRVAAQAHAANRATPILMCHGVRDPIVPVSFGSASRDALLELGYAVEWLTYPMDHSVCIEEVGAISAWLARVL
jgi:phospholipase/carboxylesterase